MFVQLGIIRATPLGKTLLDVIHRTVRVGALLHYQLN